MPYSDPERRRIGRRASYAANRLARQAVARMEWAKRNPERLRAYRRLQRYGLSAEQFEKLWLSQNGLCALCQKVLNHNGKAVHVDHCHETKRVRGILCAGCNVGLGKFGDSVVRLQAAIAYLQNSMQ